MKQLRICLFFCVGAALLAGNPAMTFGGSTGKISGRVTDKSSGEGLPGANVSVIGTFYGAATDIDGNYTVLNVPPGFYDVRITMMGYSPAKVTQLRVFVDRTTTLNLELELTVIEGQEVTIVAEREAIEFDRTNSAAYVSQEEIESLPVSTMSEIVQLQAGVVTDAGGGLHFRGGRSREVAYLIDGIPVTNTFSQGGGSNVAIENNFIQELQVITGTFNAEYGSAQSGVINVVTKVPEGDLNGTMEVITGGYYAPNKPQYIGLDNYKPFNDREIRFSVTGPVPFLSRFGKLGFFVNGRLVDSDGYLNGQRKFMPQDGWEIEMFREWYRATFDPEDPFVIPIPDSLHTGDGKTVPMNWSQSYNFNTKLSYQPSASVTFAYNLFMSRGRSKGYSWSWRFCPDGTGSGVSRAQTHMVTLTHLLKQNLFYNLRYSHQENHSKSFMFEDPNDPRYNEWAVNSWDPGKNTGFDYGGFQQWGRSWFDQSVNLANGDITWQPNKVVEIKAGFEAKGYTLHYKNAPMREVFGFEEIQWPFTRKEIEEFEFPFEFFRDSTKNWPHGTVRIREARADSARDEQFYVDYNRKPREGAAYVQTKLEMGEVILNAGVRMDYFWPKDRFAPDYSKVIPTAVGHPSYYVRAKGKSQLNPRFGLSFPISDRGALRLSYGHFFQIPSYSKMYQNPVLPHYNQFSIEETRIGNPNLKAEKTIQYEIGLQQQLTDDISMEMSVYYKDIRDLLGIEILTLSNATTFYRYANKEYGNSSGFSVAFNQGLAGGKMRSSIDYTYMLAKGSASSPETLRNIQVLAGPGYGAYTIAIRKINFLDWDQTHTLNANISYQPTRSWYISLLGQLGSGLPYSPSTLDPSIDLPGGEWDNAGRKPVRWELDLKVAKSFEVKGLKLTSYLNVFNIFNHLNENSVRSITGRAGPNAYLPEIARRRYRRIELVGDFTPEEADYNPTDYSRPRLIQFGLQMGF